MSDVKAKPFVKWVGGKRSIVNTLLQYAPKNYNLYCEPFIGGGAMYWALNPKEALLADINSELMTTYEVIQQHPKKLIESLKEREEKYHENKKDYFHSVRSDSHKDPILIASRFIFLNKTCYNGLYRVNKSGGFNAPFGKYDNPNICDATNIMLCHTALQGVVIRTCSFEKIEDCISKNNFFYLDPPYHGTYNGYSTSKFDDDSQIRLADYCKLLHKEKVLFLLSSSDTELIRELYEQFTIYEIKARRCVSCKSDGRKKENELLITNY